MVSDVTTSSVIQGQQDTAQQGITLSQDLDDFLNLLTIQLQNQDPLNPTDTDKLTDQITQFSQVEQQINTNQKLDDMLALQLSSLYSVGLGFVGLDASYISAEFPFDGENPIEVTYALGREAVQNTINVFDESGNRVYSEAGETGVGQQEFTWDGIMDNGLPAPEGTYTISVDAFDANDNSIDTTTVVTGRVRGIESQNGVIFLLVGERAVPISNIISAAQPSIAPTQASDTTDGTGDGSGDGNSDGSDTNTDGGSNA